MLDENPYQVAGLKEDAIEVLRPTTRPKKGTKIYPSTTFEISADTPTLVKIGVVMLGIHILTRIIDKIIK